MEFLDPKKQIRHRIILWVGYVLVTIGIVIAALVLLYQAYGFGIGKNGQVIQNGLVFFSSQPNPATITLNGTLNPNKTNARIAMPSGIYHVELQRAGYQIWQRTIEVEGGDVQHFDYPLLIPSKLTSKKLQTFAAAPGLSTQSPDRRWLLIQKPGSVTAFTLYDLKNPAKAPTDLNLPAGLLSKAVKSQAWQLEEWADDNKHVVLQHNYDGHREFILADRTDPAKSQNLNKTLAASPTKLTLLDKKYDQYYLFDATTKILSKATLTTPKATPVLRHVLAYQSYAADTLLYATDGSAASKTANKVQVRLKIGDHEYPVRTFPAGSDYLLDLTKYNGSLYLAVGASKADRVYIYKDPVGQLSEQPNHALVPTQVLHVNLPNYVSFSNNAQFIMAESGNRFGVYDIENEKGYNYITHQQIDRPQAHATWVDGDRLAYVSRGQLLIFDYDDTNQQVLVPANPAYLPVFAPNFKFVYTLAPDSAASGKPGQTNLNQTSLLAPADQ